MSNQETAGPAYPRTYGYIQFYRICIESLDRITESVAEEKAIEKQLKILDRSSVTQEYIDLSLSLVRSRESQESDRITAIVFAALTLEAFIYDYGCVHLSEKMIEVLEKLGPVEKWVVVPKLVTGEALLEESAGFQALKRVIRIRNHLVHYKARSLNRDRLGDEIIKSSEKSFITPAQVRTAVTLPFMMLGKLHEKYGLGWYHHDFWSPYR